MLAIDRLALASPGDAQPRPHDNCYWLLPGRPLAGEYPGVADFQQQSRRLEAMVGAGVRCVVDLTDPSEDLPPYVDALRVAAQGAAIDCQRFPIEDFSVPEATTKVSFPVPPVIESLPLPPRRTSFPSEALSVSAESKARNKSFAALPDKLSPLFVPRTSW